MRVRNWSKFQHYKQRNPPWIRLYRQIIDDQDFVSLSPGACRLLVFCWCVAAENHGELPENAERLAWRLRMPIKDVAKSLQELVTKGFIESASTTLALCKQDAIPYTDSESESETDNSESESETDMPQPAVAEIAFERFWKVYPRTKNTSKAKARESWKKQKLDSLVDLICSAAELYANDSRQIEERYVKHPVTWLNGRCWETAGEVKKQSGKTIDDLRARAAQLSAEMDAANG